MLESDKLELRSRFAWFWIARPTDNSVVNLANYLVHTM